MKALPATLLILTMIIGGCTARNVTTFILSTPCEAALAGSGNICRGLLEAMIDLSEAYPPETHDSDEQPGPADDDSHIDCNPADNGHMTCRAGLTGGVVGYSVMKIYISNLH